MEIAKWCEEKKKELKKQLDDLDQCTYDLIERVGMKRINRIREELKDEYSRAS